MLENASLTPREIPVPGSSGPPSIATTAIVEKKNMTSPALTPASRATRRPAKALPLRHVPPTPTINGTTSSNVGMDQRPTERMSMMPRKVSWEHANHAAATKSPPTSPGPATLGRRNNTLPARIKPIVRIARITNNTQFQGLAPSPKWTNPKPKQAALPSPTAASAAIGATGPHGGTSTTPATHPRAKRHRPERPSIRSNSPSIANPHSTCSAGRSPTAHCNNRSGTSSRTACLSRGRRPRLHSTAPAAATNRNARTAGTMPRSNPSVGVAPAV